MLEERLVWLAHPLTWLSRVPRSLGFGVQSPTDYYFVRSVVGERWPYYQYAEMAVGGSRLHRRLGRLHLRIANWLQPGVIVSNCYRNYLQAGCRKAELRTLGEPGVAGLVCIDLAADDNVQLSHIYNNVDRHSVMIVENIHHRKAVWRQIVADERTGVSFDLYFCGIVMFDKKRTKQQYQIIF